jgi:hypothetical protein
MDVIGFLYVSLVSSTVQLHYSLGSRRACAYSEAGFSSQNGDRAWGVYYREATLFFGFVGKRSQCKGYSKEMFPVYDGSVRSQVGQEILARMKRLKRRCGRLLYAAGFDALVKRWDECISVGGHVCVEIWMFVQVRISHVLRFISICDLFSDSPSYVLEIIQC